MAKADDGERLPDHQAARVVGAEIPCPKGEVFLDCQRRLHAVGMGEVVGLLGKFRLGRAALQRHLAPGARQEARYSPQQR